MSKYKVIIYWCEDDKAYIAEFPELPCCTSSEATYSDALKNIEVVAQEWIEAAEQLGREIPKQKSYYFTLKQRIGLNLYLHLYLTCPPIS